MTEIWPDHCKHKGNEQLQWVNRRLEKLRMKCDILFYRYQWFETLLLLIFILQILYISVNQGTLLTVTSVLH